MSETTTKKRTRRLNKVQRSVVGISLDDIKKKASMKPEVRSAQRDAALKEVKARKAANKAKSGAKKGGKGNSVGAGQRTKVPKNVARSSRGGTQR